jgi:hypothetical protein
VQLLFDCYISVILVVVNSFVMSSSRKRNLSSDVDLSTGKPVGSMRLNILDFR